MKIEGGTLKIDLGELVESLTPEQKRQVAQSLGAEEWLIRAAVESLAAGQFYADGWWFDRRTMTELRAKLAPLMDEVARECVRGLMQERNQAQAEHERVNRWAWGLFHAWPEGYSRQRPELPPFVYEPAPDDAEVTKALGQESTP